jgi:hypothetical protein
VERPVVVPLDRQQRAELRATRDEEVGRPLHAAPLALGVGGAHLGVELLVWQVEAFAREVMPDLT